MVTNKTYPRVSEVCILFHCLQNVLHVNILCLFLRGKLSSVYLTCPRNLSLHSNLFDSSVQLEVDFDVQKFKQQLHISGSCDYFSPSTAQLAQRSHPWYRQGGMNLSCWKRCAEGELGLHSSERKLCFCDFTTINTFCNWCELEEKPHTWSSMSTPGAASLTVSGQAGKVFVLSLVALKLLILSRYSFQGTF